MDGNSFYSMDKLVDFGMSVAIATQMANSMNQCISQTAVPGVTGALNIPEQVYYAVIEEKQAGPFSVTEISRLIAEKKIVKETYIWKPGMTKWDTAENLPDIMRLVALTPPPVPV